jgi:membrane protein implicated in regulation of membrane protease activity
MKKTGTFLSRMLTLVAMPLVVAVAIVLALFLALVFYLLTLFALARVVVTLLWKRFFSRHARQSISAPVNDDLQKASRALVDY